MITSHDQPASAGEEPDLRLFGIDGYGGHGTALDGVADTTETITGTSIEWADPIDLPVGDGAGGLALVHVPQFNDPGRHHRAKISEYFAWLIEVIDEAERVLERGGKLVLITKAQESRRPFLDVATLLIKPLREAGFTTPLFYTWVPSPLAAPLLRSSEPCGLDITAAETPTPTSSWRILMASKNQDRRAGSLTERAQLGLPHVSTIPESVWAVARNDVWLVPTHTHDGSVRQGDLPKALLSVIISLWSFVDDVVINPLAGSSAVADVAAELGRRALCFEPDQDLLDSIQAGRDRQGRGGG